MALTAGMIPKATSGDEVGDGYTMGLQATGIAATVAAASDVKIPTEKAIRDAMDSFETQDKTVEAHTGDDTLTAAETDNVLTNEGAAGAVVLTLPTAEAGLHYWFYVQAAQTLKVTAGASDTIRIDTLESVAAGYISSATVGSAIHLQAVNATEWVAASAPVGTWAVETS